MDQIWNSQWPKSNIHSGIYRNVPSFNTSPYISHIFQSIHHHIVNLYIQQSITGKTQNLQPVTEYQFERSDNMAQQYDGRYIIS